MPASPAFAIAVAALLTLLAALESRVLPWSPFLILYALALPLIPVAAGSPRFGSAVEVFREHGAACAGIAALIWIWEIGLMGLLYEKWALKALGKSGSPEFSPGAALESLLERVSKARRLTPRVAEAWYGIYFLAWAPVAEELFYWGYLYVTLRAQSSPWMAGAAASSFFGARHMAHFLFLPGRFPWPAAFAFALTAAVSGLLNGWMYEISGSLWPLMAAHFLGNAMFAALQGRERRTGA